MSAAAFVGYSITKNTPRDDLMALAKIAIERYKIRSGGNEPDVLIVGLNTDMAQFQPLGLPVVQNKLVFPNQVIAGTRRFVDEK